MHDSRFLWDENMHKSRFAEEYNKEGEPYNLKKRIENALASDDVLTTIEDYGLFAVNVMKGTGLSKEIYKDMIRPQAFVRENVAYGLGWYIKQNYYKGESALTHTGGDPGVAQKSCTSAKIETWTYMFTNGDNGFDIIEKVEEEFFGYFDEHFKSCKNKLTMYNKCSSFVGNVVNIY